MNHTLRNAPKALPMLAVLLALSGSAARHAYAQAVPPPAAAPTPTPGGPPAPTPVAVIPPGTYPFQNPALPAEDRITNLLSLMTRDEKIACLSTNTRVPRLGIAGTSHSEGLHGLSMGGPRTPGYQPIGLPVPPAPAPAPAGQPGPGGNGLRFAPITTTIFPQEIGLGETWDPDLIRQIGAAEGYEARYIAQNDQYHRSSLIVMAPNSDLGRDPRWGRTEECYGEDPFFNGTMVVAMVKGLQGDDPKYWQTAALLKHFLANSNEDTRDHSSSDFDERLLREYYSVPFRMGIVDGGSRAFMAAYNSYNGIPMGVNPILKDITVNEWGNDGIICTDGGAMGQLVTAHHYYPDKPHAVAGTLHAGITKYLERAAPDVNAALDQGLITEADLDRALRGNFRILIHLGLLDPPSLVPYARIGTDGAPAPWLADAHKALARRAAQESIVLLKNSGGLLPLDRRTLKSVAVIGPRADRVLLDWYSGLPPYAVSPLAGIQSKVGTGVAVRYAAGDDMNAATQLARNSDVVIVCVGNHPDGGDLEPWGKVETPSEGREAVDRQSITLEQETLIRQVYAANPKTVVALISSFPYAINWTQEHVPAIVHLTHSGQEEGNALADVLFGDINPAGRLVQTWPASLDQLPPLTDYDIRHGRTYLYSKAKPLYPFGYGLSYTTFRLSHLKMTGGTLRLGHPFTVSVDVKNTSKRVGDDVVQLYARFPRSAVSRPLEQLVGFQRVTVPPGQTCTVTLPFRADQLAYWDTAAHQFTVERGAVQFAVGHSSADTPLTATLSVAP